MLTGRRSRVAFTAIFYTFLAIFLWRFVDLDPHEYSPSNTRPPPGRPLLQFIKSSFDWTAVRQYHPVESFIPLPNGRPQTIPRVQFNFPRTRNPPGTIEVRRRAVRDAFVRSWTSYKNHAWLHDELKPMTGGHQDPFGGWAATLVDSLDTLWIMDLRDEFYIAAAEAVKLDWNKTSEGALNLFETTIRHLGGLLSAYDLSQEAAILAKARELGDILSMAFDTPNRLPGFWLNFADALSGSQLAGTHDPSASPTSLSLEFTRLAQLTGDNKYYDLIARVSSFLERTQEQSRIPGMWPTMINFQNEAVTGDDTFSVGALADSLYEYLPKMYILLSGQDKVYKKMFLGAMDAITEHILFRPMLPDGLDILFPGTAYARDGGIELNPEGQHLACFAGGMFALGGKVFGRQDHIVTGEKLARGCAWAYQAFPTGLMPEIFGLLDCKTPSLRGCLWDEERWAKDGDKVLRRGFTNARDPRYLLRPEAVESLFILYRITGQESLREVAWTMFESIMSATTTPYANAAIKDVTAKGKTEKTDSMESFWLSETLKYFYLIFSPPSLISLDDYVFNTEAHPLKRSG